MTMPIAGRGSNPPNVSKSPFQLHLDRWKKGCGSCHCARATGIVFCRGKLPCDVLFVGEAPGQSEDALSQPFIGPAGDLLDAIIAEALEEFPGLRLAFTNLVGCLPRRDDGSKSVEPDREQIETCRPRLTEFILLSKPKLIVWVGALSDKHGAAALGKAVTYAGSPGKVEGHPTIRLWASIAHPAHLLRAPEAQKSLLRQRCVSSTRRAVKALLGKE
jgi:uracil-DNA glycosylase family 4